MKIIRNKNQSKMHIAQNIFYKKERVMNDFRFIYHLNLCSPRTTRFNQGVNKCRPILFSNQCKQHVKNKPIQYTSVLLDNRI